MTRFGWKFTLAATLAVLVNLGVSHAARADAIEVRISDTLNHTLDVVAAGTFISLSPSQLTTAFPELTSASFLTASEPNPTSLATNLDFVTTQQTMFTVSVSDLNFTGPVAGGTLSASASGIYNNATTPPSGYTDSGYASSTNAKFATTTADPIPGSFSSLGSFRNSFSTPTATTAFTSAGNFSLTNTAAFTLNAGGELQNTTNTGVSVSAVPEPTSIVLGAFALPLLVFLRRRRAAA